MVNKKTISKHGMGVYICALGTYVLLRDICALEAFQRNHENYHHNFPRNHENYENYHHNFQRSDDRLVKNSFFKGVFASLKGQKPF